MKIKQIPKGPPYHGGKSNIGKEIAFAISEHVKTNGGWNDYDQYIEPFCGMLGVFRHIEHPVRKASDIDDELISMWEEVIHDNWLPKSSFPNYNKEMYLKYKIPGKTQSNQEIGTKYERGFLKYCCSVGGKRWGGYVLDKRPGRKNPVERCQIIFPQLRTHLSDIKFTVSNYSDYDEHSCIFYLDPPYANTTGYSGTPRWDDKMFWTFAMKQRFQGNLVFISNSLSNVETAAARYGFNYTILWRKLYKSGNTSIKKKKTKGTNPPRVEVLIIIK